MKFKHQTDGRWSKEKVWPLHVTAVEVGLTCDGQEMIYNYINCVELARCIGCFKNIFSGKCCDQQS